MRARLLDGIEGRPHFNFEMHGIDLIGAEEDGIPAELVRKQPDLRVPLARKLRAFEATLDRVAMDREFVTLREVATRVQRDGKIYPPMVRGVQAAGHTTAEVRDALVRAFGAYIKAEFLRYGKVVKEAGVTAE